MSELDTYRASGAERERTADLTRILPKGRANVLDIGARDGHFSRILTGHFASVTALDLEIPAWRHAGVVNVAGDATKLDFPDNSFDCIFCAEVLEHIPEVEKACREIVRVARHEIVIGVPYKQDIRVGRATCGACGQVNPPWGHVHSFDERRLLALFHGVRLTSKSFVGISQAATNPLSAWLMDQAGNPWGTYDEAEQCLHCGAGLSVPSGNRAIGSRIASRAAHYLNRMQASWTSSHGNWIHLVFSKSTR